MFLVPCSDFSQNSVVKIKRSPGVVKFKLRLSRHLWTLKVADMQKADKINQSLPPGLRRDEIKA